MHLMGGYRANRLFGRVVWVRSGCDRALVWIALRPT
ncbi:hypothetical protein FMEAI12_5060017 [Parafrankia sp. Ea1.12]|nr:hypothetical protein FMEAI12_5060017 [Parafrankia sp. Ea1.12]